MKQRTILREVSISGKGVHTGEKVTLTMKPAPVDHGIVFRRIDLYGKPEIRPGVGSVTDLVRRYTIGSGHHKIHTVEHVLSALTGSRVDNVLIEVNGSETPILDGSAKHYANLVLQAEPIEQESDRKYFALDTPISVTEGNRSIIAIPYNGLKITCTHIDDRGSPPQHLSLEIDPENYLASVAPARSFVFYDEVEELLKMGLIRGGSLDSGIVIRGETMISKEPLRFEDELVRHKILDIIGDISHLGVALKAHIIAVRTGHRLNYELTKKLDQRLDQLSEGKSKPAPAPAAKVASTETYLDIRRVLDVLPHRYPFLMVDRVVSIKDGEELVAIKNVTINEPYFLGHYPGRPLMPAVLQIETMAQAAGILLLRHISSEGKVALFMSCDKVKFRQPVTPGDQLEIHVKINRIRARKIATASCQCEVAGKVVSSADVMFAIMDAPDES